MNKKLITTYEKPISAVLLTFAVIGGIASLIAVFYPFMGLAAWKYVDGAPDKLTAVDYLIKFVLSIAPLLPWLLITGGISAILYTFVINDTEDRTFLRVWGGIMLLLFLMFIYPYIQSLFV